MASKRRHPSPEDSDSRKSHAPNTRLSGSQSHGTTPSPFTSLPSHTASVASSRSSRARGVEGLLPLTFDLPPRRSASIASATAGSYHATALSTWEESSCSGSGDGHDDPPEDAQRSDESTTDAERSVADERGDSNNLGEDMVEDSNEDLSADGGTDSGSSWSDSERGSYQSTSPSVIKPKPINVRRRRRPQARDAVVRQHPELLFKFYLASVESGNTWVFRIDSTTWVAQIYIPGAVRAHTRACKRWTLVRKLATDVDEFRYSCSNCKDLTEFGTCCHTMYVHSTQKNPLPCYSNTDYPDAQPFAWKTNLKENLITLSFACLSVSGADAVVSYVGTASDGQWDCSHDAGGKRECQHIKLCRATNTLAKLMPGAPIVTRTESSSEDETLSEFEEDMDEMAAEQERREQRSLQDTIEERSIAYKPVGPPNWCRQPTDIAPWFVLTTPLPTTFAWMDDSRCICGAPGAEGVDPSPLHDAYIYTSYGATQVTIHVKPCSKCPRSRQHFAGPDLREYGLFNFRNTSIFSHELLNSYMSRYFCQISPFFSFCKDTRNRYKEHMSLHGFVSDQLFRTAWFSYTNVLQMGKDKSLMNGCPQCGTEADCIIWDAKTVSYHKKHLLSSLTPPTEVLPTAPHREGVRPPVESTSCIVGNPRRDAQRLCRWRAGLRSNGKSRLGNIAVRDMNEDAIDADVDDVGTKQQSNSREQRRDKLDTDNYKLMDNVVRQLDKQCPALARLFEAHVNTRLDKRREKTRRLYFELLQQVLAYESVLQFAPASSWPSLGLLYSDHVDAVEHLLRDIPALGAVAAHERKHQTGVSTDLKDLAEFLRKRARRVLQSLILANPVDPQSQDNSVEQPLGPPADWRDSGQRYSSPIYRLRPVYPHLKYEQRAERAVRNDVKVGGIGCNKYYETYGKRGLTGGIMAAWCPHMVCLGWHCIPRGEGRNDAFSAMFTRWKKAPKFVIYDYACALAPYCMVREPEFFKNTKFLIDDFHAKGHTRCTAACRTETYRKHTPELTKLNTSAAECGNAGLSRIAKPVSYMSQRHAVIYTGIFLELWNCDRAVYAKEVATQLGIDSVEAFVHHIPFHEMFGYDHIADS